MASLPEYRIRELQRELSARFPAAAHVWPSGFHDPETVRTLATVREALGLPAKGGFDRELVAILTDEPESADD